MRFLRFASVVALLSLILTACQTEQVTAQEIMDRMKAARDKLQTVHVIADISLTSPEQSGTFTVEGWAKKTGQTNADGEPIAKTRLEVKQASEADLVGTIAVNDGETFYLYNPQENKVVTGKLSDFKGEGATGEDRAAQMLQLQEMLQRIIDGSDVAIENPSEQVAGKTTWRVKLTPKQETQESLGLGNLVVTTLWIDQASDVPVKAQIDASDLGNATAQATTLELDTPIADEVFVFTPPADAEVIDAAELAKQARPQATTLEQARQQVDFAVLSPATLPDGVQLDGVQVLTQRGATVIQNFSGAVNFSLVQAQGGFPGDETAPAGAQSESVTVRGQTGTLITGGAGAQQGTLLRWQENGVTIVIAGTLSAEQATSLAEALQ